GIRDGHVTGVQTCALPIYRRRALRRRRFGGAAARALARGSWRARGAYQPWAEPERPALGRVLPAALPAPRRAAHRAARARGEARRGPRSRGARGALCRARQALLRRAGTRAPAR